MHKPAKFGGFFSIDEAIYAKDWAVPSVYVYWQKNHSVWFSSALLFFHRLLGFCMHEVWLPSNKGIFNYAFSKVFFHSQSLFYWKILIAIKTAEVCQCCWGVVYVSLLKKVFEHFYWLMNSLTVGIHISISFFKEMFTLRENYLWYFDQPVMFFHVYQ